MKQVFQNFKSGHLELHDIPSPMPEMGHVHILSSCSLISAGTERMLLEFAQSGWLARARSQPDKVRLVVNKAKTDGIHAAYESVQARLNEPLPLGYCNVGTVIQNGSTNFQVGQRIVSNGPHAEVVKVAKNLVSRIPDNVDDDSAAFTIVGSIALHGIRLLKPTLGESMVVIGLGLIGQLAVQMLRANGCRVLGIDLDPIKCALASEFGAEIVDISNQEELVDKAHNFSRGHGVDGVLIATSTSSHHVMQQAAAMCRKRGRIVLIGTVGLNINRQEFYEKELTFQVSCSYGPGRYDDNYEAKGQDYPLPYVRWTEQRNFTAVLDLMSQGAINVLPLISHRMAFADIRLAYDNLKDKHTLGILLTYPPNPKSNALVSTIACTPTSKTQHAAPVRVAFLGAGNYASRFLMPSFKSAGADLVTVISAQGASALRHGKKFGFQQASTDIAQAFLSQINTVVIATRHHLHAKQIVEALNAGKHVFVEKPLALTLADIDCIEHAYRQAKNQPFLMMGFNRRFSPHIQKIKSLLKHSSAPLAMNFTMNAGAIPLEHWTQDPAIGGGRIIGEMCHYVDLMRYLAGSPIRTFNALKMGQSDNQQDTHDNAIVTLAFENGSIGSIHYLANGSKAFPKERLDIFCNNAVLQLDNFRTLKGFGWPRFKKFKTMRQDKGQDECIKQFTEAIENMMPCPIPIEQIIEVSRLIIQINDSLK